MRRVLSLLLIGIALRAGAAEEDKQLWVGQFSQCSFNAVSSVLVRFYGPGEKVTDRKAFEEKLFFAPLKQAGYGEYYGWAPWTGRMVGSGAMVWNGRDVTDLKWENFSLKPRDLPTIKGRTATVSYADGERKELEAKLLKQMKRGPVVIWTPYAAAMDKGGKPWHHVTAEENGSDRVPFGPFTHAVTLFLREKEAIVVTDCSARDGVYETDAHTIVATSAAMSAFVRIKDGKGSSTFDRGLRGAEDDAFNVVFWKDDPATKPAK